MPALTLHRCNRSPLVLLLVFAANVWHQTDDELQTIVQVLAWQKDIQVDLHFRRVVPVRPPLQSSPAPPSHLQQCQGAHGTHLGGELGLG